jgi:hypothetical protein
MRHGDDSNFTFRNFEDHDARKLCNPRSPNFAARQLDRFQERHSPRISRKVIECCVQRRQKPISQPSAAILIPANGLKCFGLRFGQQGRIH